jgi:septin family protein
MSTRACNNHKQQKKITTKAKLKSASFAVIIVGSSACRKHVLFKNLLSKKNAQPKQKTYHLKVSIFRFLLIKAKHNS